ncbi:carbon-nitrogen hydrolase family protein [Spongorhabdus nitratireducens]
MSADILYKAAVVQMCSGTGIGANLKQASLQIGFAAKKGARLVVLPEMFAAIGGDAARFGPAASSERQLMAELAKQHGIWLIAGTLPCCTPKDSGIPGDKAWASCFVYDPSGNEVVRYDKIHLFDAEVTDGKKQYRESDHYRPGYDPVVFDTPFGRVGLAICFDLRFPELFRELRQLGAEVICVPAAFTKVTGEAHWEVLLRARAIENQCWVLGANQSGKHEEGRETWGHSMIVSPWGDTKVLSDFSPGVLFQTINLTQVEQLRKKMPGAPQMLSCDPSSTSLP